MRIPGKSVSFEKVSEEEPAKVELALVESEREQTTQSTVVSDMEMPTFPALPVIVPDAPGKTSGPVIVPDAPGKTSGLSTSGKKLTGKAKPEVAGDVADEKVLQERCRQFCLSTFFRNSAAVRSLGFTSAIAGEGKSFLSIVMASVLADDSPKPVTLLECNWDHPCFQKHFGIAGQPGLAEWLRGDCHERDIRHRINRNLSVIPAGNGQQDAVRLLQQIRQRQLLDLFGNVDELFIVDLPSVMSSAYGALAASIVESLIIVLRAGVTTDLMVAETYERLKDLPVQGVVLNQIESHIPRWIRQLM